MTDPTLTVTDVDPNAAAPAAPANPAPAPAAPTFAPIVPPPSDHHPLNTGLGTEMGDTPKSMIDKINSGFENVMSMLESLGAKGVTKVETSVSADASKAVEDLRDWIAKTFVSITDHQAVAKQASDAAAAAQAATAAVANAVPKADHDKVASDLADLQKRFATLGSHIEAFLGLNGGSGSAPKS